MANIKLTCFQQNDTPLTTATEMIFQFDSLQAQPPQPIDSTNLGAGSIVLQRGGFNNQLDIYYVTETIDAIDLLLNGTSTAQTGTSNASWTIHQGASDNAQIQIITETGTTQAKGKIYSDGNLTTWQASDFQVGSGAYVSVQPDGLPVSVTTSIDLGILSYQDKITTAATTLALTLHASDSTIFGLLKRVELVVTAGTNDAVLTVNDDVPSISHTITFHDAGSYVILKNTIISTSPLKTGWIVIEIGNYLNPALSPAYV